MRNVITIVIATISLAHSGCLSEADQEARGRRMAERDLREGTAKLFWRGKPMPHHREYAQLLKDRLKLTLSFEPEARELSAGEVAFQDAYTGRVQEEFAKGKVTLRTIDLDAKALYNARNK